MFKIFFISIMYLGLSSVSHAIQANCEIGEIGLSSGTPLVDVTPKRETLGGPNFHKDSSLIFMKMLEKEGLRYTVMYSSGAGNVDQMFQASAIEISTGKTLVQVIMTAPLEIGKRFALIVPTENGIRRILCIGEE